MSALDPQSSNLVHDVDRPHQQGSFVDASSLFDVIYYGQ
jgi:hypothetical protein